MHGHINPKNNQPSPLIADDIYQIIIEVRRGSLASFVTRGLLSHEHMDKAVCHI